ncbi:MAG: MinD/ParA family protein [Proteobacteria bacterium]|nr:MinD/ParA family protein [Pseudomonadota bacterium]MBU1708884.1 MinD/ParA family protein [Pseudomonadota bacterium]
MTQADTLEKIMTSKPSPTSQGPEMLGRSASRSSSPRVICITSGKGGVGKTNISANLGYSLARSGKKVLILDADLNLANVDILLGLTPRFNLHHVFTGEKTIPDILVKGPAGLLILPASSGIMELADLTEAQRLFFLSEMEALGNYIDILIIDTAAGINNNVIYFNLAAQERVVVLTPEPTSLTDAYALIKVLSSRHDVKKFRILINQAHSEKEALAVFRKLSMVIDRFLATMSLDFLGFIPTDQKLPKAVRSQRLVCDLFPDAPSSRKFSELSAKIISEETETQVDGNIKFFWKGLFDL